MDRKSLQKRKTNETEVEVNLNIDGTGKSSIKTGIDFLDHMLDLLAFFSLFDLEVKAKGDLGIDIHHTNEDIGITIGKALKECLGEGRGINRFGYAFAPMDECLVRVVIDICGRAGYERSDKGVTLIQKEEGKYSLDDGDHFLESLSKQCGINMDITIIKGSADVHHVLEAAFKASGLALKMACAIDPRREGISSTKGIIDL
ncbi:MAG: imidazoleglycerol-phosphate dehydratase HisB [Candidatus Omnitrophica bacterium]|nr:imidazoleglycerol-phosphate dehydratase HisB [Candidatus Omnitrophota bacterium]